MRATPYILHQEKLYLADETTHQILGWHCGRLTLENLNKFVIMIFTVLGNQRVRINRCGWIIIL